MKILKVGIAVVVFVVVAVVAVLALFEIPIDVTPYKGRIEALVKEATGRALTLEGDLTLFASLTPRVEVVGVSLSNAPWGTQSDMVSASRLQVEIALLPALSGTVHVRRLVLDRPFILLETRKDGRVNWDMRSQGDGRPKQEEASSGPPVSGAVSSSSLPIIDLFDLVEGKIVFKAEGEEEKTLSLKRVSLFGFNASPSASFAASGAYDEMRFDLTGAVEARERSERSEPSYAVKGAGTIAGIFIDVDGVVSDLGTHRAVDVKAAVKTDGEQTVGPMQGLPTTVFSGRVVGGDNAYTFEDIVLSVGKSQAKGQGKVLLARAPPKVEIVLLASSLDLGEVFPAPETEATKAADTSGAEGKEPTKKTGKVFSSAPLPWEVLQSVDARFDVQAESVTLPSGQELGAVSLKGTLGNGVLAATSSLRRRDGGAFQLETGIEVSSAGKAGGARAAVRIDGKAERLMVADFLPPSGKNVAVEAVPLDASWSLKARGGSVAELMATLSGRFLVELGPGRIRTAWLDGFDVADVRRRLERAGRAEEWLSLTCGVVNLKADNGVLSWDRQVALQTGKVDLVSSGRVDLGPETLDVVLAPLRWEGRDTRAGRISSLFRVTGSLSHPNVELDAENAVRGALEFVEAQRNKGKRSTIEDAASPCATALLESPPSVRELPPLTDLLEEQATKAIERELKKSSLLG